MKTSKRRHDGGGISSIQDHDLRPRNARKGSPPGWEKEEGKEMIIYAEFRELANACDNIRATAEKLKHKIDISDMGLFEVYLSRGCTERDGHLFQDGKQLDNCGVQFNQYYLQQFHGFCEDSYYGTMYFKTTTPGEFVAVPFYS